MEQRKNGLTPAPGLEERFKLALNAQPDLRNQLESIRWSLLENRDLLDSANIDPTDWEALAEQCLEIAGNSVLKVDAIIIIHGTDTLAYTSSALAFFLQRVKIPVILTGSQKPLGAPHSDALDNLIGAMLKAQNTQPGVWVYFNQQLMPGARVVKKDAISFAGFAAPRIHGSKPVEVCPPPIIRQSTVRRWSSIKVATVHMLPGYDYSLLQAIIDSHPQAIILSLYGLGTLANQNSELLDTLDAACHSGIILVAVTQCYIGYIDYSIYASGAELDRLGILSGRDITLEAAYAKLMVLLRFGYSQTQLKCLFAQNLADEMSGVPN
jgi:L-asparaginase